MNLSMNSAMNNAMHAAGTGATAPGPVAANAAPTLDAAQLLGGALTASLATTLPQAGAQVLPFQHWIAQGGAVLEPVAAAPDDGAPVDGAAPLPAVPGELDPVTDSTEPVAEQPVVADVLVGAMAPPVAPAALPAMMMAMPGAPTPAKPAAANDGADTAPVPVGAAGGSDTPLIAAPAPAARAVPDAVVPPLPAAPASARPDAAPAAADAPAADTGDAAPTVTGAGVQSAATPASTRGADTIKLAGPPSAWRQSLHEALGDKLSLQVGRNIDQATIRLDPPNLGRIDISIRHSGGNLEVHIAASNADVLRQLNTVSDSLRNDLAGRQYSSVSVSVTETPRAQAGAQAGNQPSGQPGADAQGRGRQQEQQAERTPGLALNDAGDPGSQFSMNGRD